MKKYVVALLMCLLLIPTMTNAATVLPKINITSTVEPGDTEVEVAVTNYRDEMDGYIAVAVGEDIDESPVDEDVLLFVPELEKGNKLTFYYVYYANEEDDEETRKVLKTVTVTDPLLPKVTVPNGLTEKSETIGYTITNYDTRFEEQALIARVDEDDVASEDIVGKTGLLPVVDVLQSGTQVKLYYVNKNDREFYLQTINVQAAAAPKLVVPASVTNRTKIVNVTYEKGSSVTLKSGKKTYTGKELANGQYELTIPSQKVGTTLIVIAITNSGDKQTKTITVKKKSGTTVTVKSITTKTTKVTGTTKNTIKGDKVEVIIGNKTYKTTLTKANGSYSIKIPKQKTKTLIKTRVMDSAGNVLYTVSKRVVK